MLHFLILYVEVNFLIYQQQHLDYFIFNQQLQQVQSHSIYLFASEMSKLNGQTLIKITNILKIPQAQREQQQVHFLSLNYKKNMICISNIIDWWMLTKCIQNLQLHDQKSIKKENIDWIFVLKGSFDFHGMIYRQGEQFSVQKQYCEHLSFQQNSLFSVLTHQTKQKARLQTQQRKNSQLKTFAKAVIFGKSQISHKDLNKFWEGLQQFKIKKGQIFAADQANDMIFVVISGSVNINYQWKRLIKLRELGPGSIFSTFLGRYFYKTSQQLKQMQKHQFQIIGKQQTLIYGFSPDIFYQQYQFVHLKFIVQNAWKLYLKRVEQIKRIIQTIGVMKPDKQEVKQNIKQQIQTKYLRQKCISVPVAIQRRKLRKITYQIYEQKSTRRKLPNTQSAKQIITSRTQATDHRQTLTSFSTNIKKEQNLIKSMKNTLDSLMRKSNTVHFRKYRTLSQQNITISHNHSIQNRLKTSRQRQRQGWGEKQKRQNPENKFMASIDRNQQNQEQGNSFYRFFRPEQFISKKLKNHYQSVLMNAQTFRIPLDQTLHLQKPKEKYKNKKQYFQQYVNQRRILKLGPKKRLLYKKRAGF